VSQADRFISNVSPTTLEDVPQVAHGSADCGAQNPA